MLNIIIQGLKDNLEQYHIYHSHWRLTAFDQKNDDRKLEIIDMKSRIVDEKAKSDFVVNIFPKTGIRDVLGTDGQLFGHITRDDEKVSIGAKRHINPAISGSTLNFRHFSHFSGLSGLGINRRRDGSGWVEDLSDSSHLLVHQSDLDSVGMSGRFGQDILDDSAGQLPGALIFFQYNADLDSGVNIHPVPCFHHDALFGKFPRWLFHS